jgi:hypothetical protein
MQQHTPLLKLFNRCCLLIRQKPRCHFVQIKLFRNGLAVILLSPLNITSGCLRMQLVDCLGRGLFDRIANRKHSSNFTANPHKQTVCPSTSSSGMLRPKDRVNLEIFQQRTMPSNTFCRQSRRKRPSGMETKLLVRQRIPNGQPSIMAAANGVRCLSPGCRHNNTLSLSSPNYNNLYQLRLALSQRSVLSTTTSSLSLGSRSPRHS